MIPNTEALLNIDAFKDDKYIRDLILNFIRLIYVTVTST